MSYAIQVINKNENVSFTFVIDSTFVIDGTINLQHTLKAYKLDSKALFDAGNRIILGTLENDEFKPLNEFKKV